MEPTHAWKVIKPWRVRIRTRARNYMGRRPVKLTWARSFTLGFSCRFRNHRAGRKLLNRQTVRRVSLTGSPQINLDVGATNNESGGFSHVLSSRDGCDNASLATAPVFTTGRNGGRRGFLSGKKWNPGRWWVPRRSRGTGKTMVEDDTGRPTMFVFINSDGERA